MHHEQMQAARAITLVLAGANLRDALAQVDDGDPSRGRALVQELSYGTLRRLGTLDAIAARLVRKPMPDPLLRSLVDVALYQLDETRAPAFAVVDRAVAAAGELVRPGAKGLVNAILRRYLRERASLHASVRRDDVARWSYPKWWIDRVRRDQPAHWEAILDAGNARPPLTLRVNCRVTNRDSLLAAFADAGVQAAGVGECGIIVTEPRPVTELPGFAAGQFSVQDLGAQLATPLLGVADGMRVLDACAAPGGKTSHLLEQGEPDLVALDIDIARIARIRDNLVRLRLADRRVRVMQANAGEPRAWWDGRPFDRILLDVPCTASGVVRRHPDGKWRHRESDIERFSQEQTRLLDAVWPLLGGGGRLLYSTCSVFEAENGQRIADFLARHPDALRESLTFPQGTPHCDGQLLPSSSGTRHNQDGFFYALLGKR
jgi:16S rRNA (cytosine967-C5)-methyltransferase